MPQRTQSNLSLYGSRSFQRMLGVALVVCVVTSCDEVDHHKTMTFFFDGVPPLRNKDSEGPFVDPNVGEDTGAQASSGWYVHEPLKTCTECHADRRRTGSSPKVQLVAEVPQLCARCHTEYARLPGWVHGPVASGNCLLCHEPHKTRNQFLLTKAVPQLCYQCHEPQALALIENHANASYTRCLECHDGHTSSTRGLLRHEFLQSEAGVDYRVQMYRQQYEQALTNARDDAARGSAISAMLYKAVGLIEEDRPWEARAYLEVLLTREGLTEAENTALTDTLEHLTALTAADSRDSQAELSAAIRDLWKRRTEREQATAELYYRSVQAYHAGRLADAKAGFIELLDSDILLKPMRQTVERYLAEINKTPGGTRP